MAPKCSSTAPVTILFHSHLYYINNNLHLYTTFHRMQGRFTNKEQVNLTGRHSCGEM